MANKLVRQCLTCKGWLSYPSGGKRYVMGFVQCPHCNSHNITARSWAKWFEAGKPPMPYLPNIAASDTREFGPKSSNTKDTHHRNCTPAYPGGYCEC